MYCGPGLLARTALCAGPFGPAGYFVPGREARTTLCAGPFGPAESFVPGLLARTTLCSGPGGLDHAYGCLQFCRLGVECELHFHALETGTVGIHPQGVGVSGRPVRLRTPVPGIAERVAAAGRGTFSSGNAGVLVSWIGDQAASP